MLKSMLGHNMNTNTLDKQWSGNRRHYVLETPLCPTVVDNLLSQVRISCVISHVAVYYLDIINAVSGVWVVYF